MKTRFTLFICVVCALVMLVGCGKTDSTPSNSPYQKITAAYGRDLLENGVPLILVDVRRADEYEDTHIPSAINIPNESIESTRPEALPDLNQIIVVYCRTGTRSKQAAEKLIKMGYTDVRDMGGIADWPYDTITGSKPGEYVVTDSKNDTVSSGIMGSFSTKDINGNDVDQSIFAQYDLTMVNAWATYCGPCLAEMPELGELADEYESKGVRIVGIVLDVFNSDGTVSDSQLETARSIIAKTDADYTHILPAKGFYELLVKITAVPTTFFVDSNGSQVGSTYIGSKSKAEWNEIIIKTLEEIQK